MSVCTYISFHDADTRGAACRLLVLGVNTGSAGAASRRCSFTELTRRTIYGTLVVGLLSIVCQDVCMSTCYTFYTYILSGFLIRELEEDKNHLHADPPPASFYYSCDGLINELPREIIQAGTRE